MKTSVLFPAACAGLALVTPPARAGTGISYTTPGAEYAENFDVLPTKPPLANIQTAAADAYLNGWLDDSITVAGEHVGVPGWHLYHPLPQTEGGTNLHQRVRMGAGANTGSFWIFYDSATPSDKALGSLGSNTMTDPDADMDQNMYIGLRLVNRTGKVLGGFTVTYDGEQWRDGQSAAGETLFFAYSLTANLDTWFQPGTDFTAVPALHFTSPVIAGTGTSGTAVNGNAAGRVADLTATVSGLTWNPDTELWLRWTDPQLAFHPEPTAENPKPLSVSIADDGLAIDNFRFSAAAAPIAIPEANLTVTQNPGGQWQLEWKGGGAFTYQVQHTTGSSLWTSLGIPAAESEGTMTWVIPQELLGTGRHFFRLLRAVKP